MKDLLSPYLQEFHVYPKPVLLVTSKKKNARGGLISYVHAKRDLDILTRQFKNNDNERHLYTTMFDFYALPDDFPGFVKSKEIPNVRQRISSLEDAFLDDIGNDDFIPYLQLHEFEALLFTDINTLAPYYPLSKSKIAKLKAETDKYQDPEMIDDGPDTAPSKRIIKAIEKEYNYNKVQSGAAVALDIGIEALLSHCQHFREWIAQIIASASRVTN